MYAVASSEAEDTSSNPVLPMANATTRLGAILATIADGRPRGLDCGLLRGRPSPVSDRSATGTPRVRFLFGIVDHWSNDELWPSTERIEGQTGGTATVRCLREHLHGHSECLLDGCERQGLGRLRAAPCR